MSWPKLKAVPQNNCAAERSIFLACWCWPSSLHLLLAIFANRNSTLAQQNASIAQTAQAEPQAIADFTRSEAQRLAAEASSLMQSRADPQLIALLSLRSINTQYTIEGDAALTGAAALPLPQRIFTGT